MAFRKTLVDRLMGLSKNSAAAATGGPKSRCHSAVPPPSLLHRLLPRRSSPTAAAGLLRRFLHQDGTVASAAAFPHYRFSLPVGDKLVEKLRGLTGGDRIRIDALSPPMPPDRDREGDAAAAPSALAPITVEDARKVLRVSQTEAVKAKLRAIPDSSISRHDFLNICTDAAGPDGQRIAHALDESGAVLVLGDVVFLRPEQVARAIESMIPLNLRRKTGAAAPSSSTVDTASAAEEEELRALEAQRALIESKAESGVRRELWLGLGFLMAQTAGFARLTFWELSWDVMEPICFYVSTVYFMVGYAFFLRTSRDPSFEGIYENRLAARRKRLMKSQGFNLGRYVELRRALGRDVGAGYPSLPTPPRPCLEPYHTSPCQSSAALASYCGCHRREGLLA